MTHPKRRIAAYIRVSSTEQKTDLQRLELDGYIKARGWDDVTFYEEKLTGTNTNRPEFKRLMSDARSRSIDIVVVWKLDRFARSLRDLINNLQELTNCGVEFISLKDQIDMTSSMGRLMLHIIGAFGEFEASLIKDRCRAGILAAREKGIRLGRPPEVDVEQVRRLRSNGMPLSQIAKQVGCSKTAVHKSLSKKA